jgi:hypothetical protein
VIPHDPKVKLSCNPDVLTVPYVNKTLLEAPEWNQNLLIVSSVTVPAGNNVSQVAFWKQNTSYVKAVNNIDFVIYNTTASGYPGTLLAAMYNVDITGYNNSQFSCVSLPNSLSFPSTTKLWIGFRNYVLYPGSVIERQYFTTGDRYYYLNGVYTVPTNFPFGASNGENKQLVMGLIYGTACSSKDCDSCTAPGSSCVWCLNSGSCIPQENIPTCPSWTRSPLKCHICHQYTNCSSCASVEYNCTWCESTHPSVCLPTSKDLNCTTAITNPEFCEDTIIYRDDKK